MCAMPPLHIEITKIWHSVTVTIKIDFHQNTIVKKKGWITITKVKLGLACRYAHILNCVWWLSIH